MKKTSILILALVSFFGLISAVQNDPTLVTIDGKEIKKSSFEYLYNKNNSFSEAEVKSPEEYMDLFINFKLKVNEAEKTGMDTTKAFVTEFEQYRKIVAAPYLTDTEYRESLMKKAFERSRTEIEVSHILIRCDQFANPTDTAMAYKRAQEVLTRLQTENFKDVAVSVSDDPSVKQNFGNLGYLGSMTTVAPFEDAMYSTEVGKISKLVRSMYGYHILKVTNKRAARPEIKVAHIMKSVIDSIPGADEKAQKEIKEIYIKLIAGEDFGALAKTYSDDKGTAENNGELPWFGPRRIVQEFEDAAYGLSKKGNFTQAVRTPYGWHIIKLIDKKSLADFETMKPELERQLSMGDRQTMINASYTAKLKARYKYTENAKITAELISLAAKNNWNDSLFYAQVKKNKKVLISFGKETYTQSDFIEYCSKNNLKSTVISENINAFAAEKLNAYHEKNLGEIYPEYKNLVQEYKDGILLFNISSEKIWNKASEDTIALKEFFIANKEKYNWDKSKFKGRILYCKTTKAAAEVENILLNAPKDSVDVMLNRLNETERVLKVERGIYAEGANATVDKYAFKKDTEQTNKDYPYVVMDGRILNNGPESYKDVSGVLIQDYQNKLEKEWIEELRKKYPVIIDQEVLKTVKKNTK